MSQAFRSVIRIAWAASALIDALKSGRAGEMAKAQTSRDLMEYENAVDAGTFTGSYGEWVELY
jgi:hypothetical protein